MLSSNNKLILNELEFENNALLSTEIVIIISSVKSVHRQTFNKECTLWENIFLTSDVDKYLSRKLG